MPPADWRCILYCYILVEWIFITEKSRLRSSTGINYNSRICIETSGSKCWPGESSFNWESQRCWPDGQETSDWQGDCDRGEWIQVKSIILLDQLWARCIYCNLLSLPVNWTAQNLSSPSLKSIECIYFSWFLFSSKFSKKTVMVLKFYITVYKFIVRIFA